MNWNNETERTNLGDQLCVWRGLQVEVYQKAVGEYLMVLATTEQGMKRRRAAWLVHPYVHLSFVI